ncbi:unnamed protein product [Pleuronectes platessa]|uniref:Uncharacterized protein n=1 Tax=Pleuronectes platessa TaxID=8262 RepID=A0A9N7YGL4_PLEPL|nr:unnamed protein product [Pleuronectes platessa]
MGEEEGKEEREGGMEGERAATSLAAERCHTRWMLRRQKEREEGGVDYYSATGLTRLPTNYLSTSKSPDMQPKQAGSRAGRRGGDAEFKATLSGAAAGRRRRRRRSLKY